MEPGDISALVQQYTQAEGLGSSVETWPDTQYDDIGAAINYALIRHFKPKTVVEFGARSGRCTHDMAITKWVFETLLPKCRVGALVQIHDIPLTEDFRPTKKNLFSETDHIIDLHRQGKLPLEKVYWAAEHDQGEASWWRYVPCA